MRIGLFGGTFDPIHWGHLRSAEEVSEAFSLDRIIFIPTSKPPHKRGQTTTSARDRLAMVRLAVAENPRFSVSTVEIRRPGVSYSIDTLRNLTARSTRGRISSSCSRSAILLSPRGRGAARRISWAALPLPCKNSFVMILKRKFIVIGAARRLCIFSSSRILQYRRPTFALELRRGSPFVIWSPRRWRLTSTQRVYIRPEKREHRQLGDAKLLGKGLTAGQRRAGEKGLRPGIDGSSRAHFHRRLFHRLFRPLGSAGAE